MLGKAQPLFRASGGEYTDICEMHEIGNCLDYHSNYIRGTFTLPGPCGQGQGCTAPNPNYGVPVQCCGAPNPACGSNTDIVLGAPCTASVESLRYTGEGNKPAQDRECLYGGSRSLKSFQVSPPPAKPPKPGVFFHTDPLVPDDLNRQPESPYGKIVRNGDHGKSTSPDLVPDTNTGGPLTVACPKTPEEGRR